MLETKRVYRSDEPFAGMAGCSVVVNSTETGCIHFWGETHSRAKARALHAALGEVLAAIDGEESDYPTPCIDSEAADAESLKAHDETMDMLSIVQAKRLLKRWAAFRSLQGVRQLDEETRGFLGWDDEVPEDA